MCACPPPFIIIPTQELSVPLTRYTSGFPDPHKLHPFEASLLHLTVSTTTYTWVALCWPYSVCLMVGPAGAREPWEGA